MKMDDDLVDDVFEDEYHPKNYYENKNTGLNCNEATFLDDITPSPKSKHPAFRIGSSAADDDWKSYKIDENTEFDESILHKVNCKLMKIESACFFCYYFTNVTEAFENLNSIKSLSVYSKERLF